MCQFVSWVEKRGKVCFLTGEQLFGTELGQELLPKISRDDYCGHGTIRAYYGIDAGDGVNRECTDFSSPDNFPIIIAMAIKAGKMRGLGFPKGLLLDAVNAKWQAERDAVDAKWQAEWG